MSDQKPGQKTVPREGPLVGSLSRPAGVSMPRGIKRRQLAILIIDTSGSMSGGKIDEANAAAVGLKQKLAEPETNGAFAIAEVTYAETARVLVKAKLASAVDDFELTATVVNEFTNITAGLEEAMKLIELPPIGPGNWLRPIFVLLTDGGHNRGKEPYETAMALKSRADLLGIGFGADADMPALRRLATSPQHAFHCKDGADLRRFFAQIGATLSRSIQSNQDAVALLGGGVRRG